MKEKHKKWLHRIEVWVDHLIIPMLIVILINIVLELGFPLQAEKYHIYIQIGDYLVVLVFVLDLIFKYRKTRNIPRFIRKYWLDIIAVFPFFLIFRMVEEIGGLVSKTFREGFVLVQGILHEGVEIEKEGSRITKEVETISKLSRSERFAKFIKPLLRSPRFIKAVTFFEKPSHYKSRKK